MITASDWIRDLTQATFLFCRQTVRSYSAWKLGDVHISATTRGRHTACDVTDDAWYTATRHLAAVPPPAAADALHGARVTRQHATSYGRSSCQSLSTPRPSHDVVSRSHDDATGTHDADEPAAATATATAAAATTTATATAARQQS